MRKFIKRIKLRCRGWLCNWECGGCDNCGCFCTCDD